MSVVRVDARDAAAVTEALLSAAECMRTAEGRRGATQWIPSRGMLLATGDLHDNLAHLQAVLQLARLDASPDHHVILHELIHGESLTGGMDTSYRMLVRVAELVLAYPLQVHPLLANHELAQLCKLRISKGAGEQVQLFLDGLEWVFGDEAQQVSDAVDRFILAMPLAVRSANGLFCAHSTPAPFEVESADMSALERELDRAGYADHDGLAWQFTWGRGQTPESSLRVAERLGARLMVCGHAHVEQGAEAVSPELLILNSDHARGVAVEIPLEGPLPPATDLAREAVFLATVGFEG
ncbi:MAG: hypothetical protein FJ270_00525 [Planctomycetes bacterium]|nr:hypothetical protein [Planctomycetota bacterium]